MTKTEFSFTQIIPRCYTRSSEPNLIVGKGAIYITGAFFAKYGMAFKKVRVYWDEGGGGVVGLHFHSAANRVPDTFRLRQIAKSTGRAFSSKALRERVHQACGEGTFVGLIEPAPAEGPDFFICRLRCSEAEA